jgi:hypothetical protein
LIAENVNSNSHHLHATRMSEILSKITHFGQVRKCSMCLILWECRGSSFVRGRSADVLAAAFVGDIYEEGDNHNLRPTS